MNKQWSLIAKKQAKRYVHAYNHIVKAFIGEQTLMGRNDRLNLSSDETVKSRVSLFINKQQCLFANLSHYFIR